MIKIVTILIHIAFMLIMLFGGSLSANNSVEPYKEISIPLFDNVGEKDFVGNWVYLAENVPVEFSKGIIHIINSDGSLIVEVAMESMRFIGQEVKLADDTLNFKMNVEGQYVSVVLKVRGNKISGEGTSPEGTFTLTGTKREES